MNEITILIIGIGIGYFWAMHRAENIKITGIKVYPRINAREFWEQLEKWAMDNPVKPTTVESEQPCQPQSK
ncbi:hypothetical protein KI809_18820 [Geobacter pelophilus]|uniref:Uncharacterized protein n=1 Tax=Geoanaerobacter pelophilus TaxID=60036 RepID=A0AAW4LD63_9BACT|nr:hypothetical protein [Geoanaerobacter pelophilus]MBT0666366.1 hypothetical protein [Geoanaerobacter pelophilus]